MLRDHTPSQWFMAARSLLAQVTQWVGSAPLQAFLILWPRLKITLTPAQHWSQAKGKGRWQDHKVALEASAEQEPLWPPLLFGPGGATHQGRAHLLLLCLRVSSPHS